MKRSQLIRYRILQVLPGEPQFRLQDAQAQPVGGIGQFTEVWKRFFQQCDKGNLIVR
jgi:hypothetical protein